MFIASAPAQAPASDERSADAESGSRSGHVLWRDVRIPHVLKIMLALCAASFALILYESRHLDFYYDEWSFAEAAPHWHLHDYFVPHNEHWSTVPMIVYKVMLATVGMHSYVPYMAALLLIHVSAAFLLFLIIRRRCGDVLALCAGGILLFLGRAYENLVWAFQVSFDGSVVFGLLALYLLTGRPIIGRRRAVAGSLALLMALMCSGMGLFFLVAVAVDFAIRRERRQQVWLLWAVAVPAAAYMAWYIAFGRQGTASDPSIFQLKTLLGLATFVPVGIGAAAAGVFGLFAWWAPLGLTLLLAAGVLLWFRRREDTGLAVAAAVAILAQYTLIGLVRQRYGLVEAASPRYVYIGGVFVLLIFTEALRNVRWRGLWRTVAPITAAGLIAGSAYVLVHEAHLRTKMLSIQRYDLEITWLLRNAPGLQHDVAIDHDLLPNVTPSLYFDARDRYGTPLHSLTVQELSKLPEQVVNNAMRQLMPAHVAQTTTRPANSQCTTTIPTRAQKDVTIRGGSHASLESVDATATTQVILNTWYERAAPAAGDQPQTAPAGHALRVAFPDTGRGLNWHFRVKNTGSNAVALCLDNDTTP
jgi:hypothetical protein